jgi:hypothetical protein
VRLAFALCCCLTRHRPGWRQAVDSAEAAALPTVKEVVTIVSVLDLPLRQLVAGTSTRATLAVAADSGLAEQRPQASYLGLRRRRCQR